MKTSPPGVISHYFKAVNGRLTDEATACFASDAQVHDESQTHTGRSAIRAWIEDTTQRYSPQAEVLLLQPDEDRFIATARVAGTFPGSPVELDYIFTVNAGEITHLTIQ